jgi:hypothetical protein
MNRRTFLRVGGSIGVLAVTGCSGNGGSEFDLSVTNQDIDRDSEGHPIVNVTISNPGNSRQNGTLYVTTKLNGKERVRVREVSVDAHKTTRITITYNETMEGNSSFSVRTDLQPSE